jgi:acyl carrier protein
MSPIIPAEAHQRTRSLVAAAMGVPVDALPDEAAIGALDAWDSLAHLRLLLAIEESLARELTADESASVLSLADVTRLLNKHGS